MDSSDRADLEICRLYVELSLHGSGPGHDLLDRAEAYAIAKRAAVAFLPPVAPEKTIAFWHAAATEVAWRAG